MTETHTEHEFELPKHVRLEGLQARLLAGQFDKTKLIQVDDINTEAKVKEGFEKTKIALTGLSLEERSQNKQQVSVWAKETAEKINNLPKKYKEKAHLFIMYFVEGTKEAETLSTEDLGDNYSAQVLDVFYKRVFLQPENPIGLFLEGIRILYKSSEEMQADLNIIQWFAGIFGADSATVITQLFDLTPSEEKDRDKYYTHLAKQSQPGKLSDKEKQLLDRLNVHAKNHTVLPVKNTLVENEIYSPLTIFSSFKKPVEPAKNLEYFMRTVPDAFAPADTSPFIPAIHEPYFSSNASGTFVQNPLSINNTARYVEAEELTNGDSSILALCAVSASSPEAQAKLFLHVARIIVEIHAQYPLLLEEWEAVQRKDSISHAEFTNNETKRKTRIRSEALSTKLQAKSVPALIELSELYGARNEVWRGRITALNGNFRKLPDQLKFNPINLRWIEYLSHSIDVAKLVKEIKAAGEIQPNPNKQKEAQLKTKINTSIEKGEQGRGVVISLTPEETALFFEQSGMYSIAVCPDLMGRVTSVEDVQIQNGEVTFSLKLTDIEVNIGKNKVKVNGNVSASCGINQKRGVKNLLNKLQVTKVSVSASSGTILTPPQKAEIERVILNMDVHHMLARALFAHVTAKTIEENVSFSLVNGSLEMKVKKLKEAKEEGSRDTLFRPDPSKGYWIQVNEEMKKSKVVEVELSEDQLNEVFQAALIRFNRDALNLADDAFMKDLKCKSGLFVNPTTAKLFGYGQIGKVELTDKVLTDIPITIRLEADAKTGELTFADLEIPMDSISLREFEGGLFSNGWQLRKQCTDRLKEFNIHRSFQLALFHEFGIKASIFSFSIKKGKIILEASI